MTTSLIAQTGAAHGRAAPAVSLRGDLANALLPRPGHQIHEPENSTCARMWKTVAVQPVVSWKWRERMEPQKTKYPRCSYASTVARSANDGGVAARGQGNCAPCLAAP